MSQKSHPKVMSFRKNAAGVRAPMNSPLYLSRFETTVLSGAEWPLGSSDWMILQLFEGNAYALIGGISRELPPGGIIVCPPKPKVTMLASVLGDAMFRAFVINISLLSGFVTAWERRCLENEVARLCEPFLVWPVEHPLAKRASNLFWKKTHDAIGSLGVCPSIRGTAGFSAHFSARGKQKTGTDQENAKERLRNLWAKCLNLSWRIFHLGKSPACFNAVNGMRAGCFKKCSALASLSMFQN